MVNKYTEGLEQVGDRFRLRENISITKADLVEIEPSDKTIVEAVSGGKGVVSSYRMKVWEAKKMSGKPSLNLNKRYYDPIFERVLSEQPVTLALMNHPEGNSDGSPKDIWAVQSKPMIEEGWLTCQVDLVGDYGRLAEEVLEAGGAVAISSSALGKISEDGGIVNDPSFLLERFGDWILRPSNNYYHYKSEMTESAKKPIEENNTILVEETIDNKQEEKIKENDKTMTENTKLLKLNLKNMIKEADKSTNADEKLLQLEEALSYCDSEELKDLHESITSKIETVNESIMARAKEADVLEENVKAKETEVSEVKESVKEKEGIVSKLKAITEAMKGDFNRNKLILEKQTELKEEAEAKSVIVERDLQEMIEKNLVLESALDEALVLANVVEAEDKEKKDDEDKEDDKKDDEDKVEVKKEKMTPAEVKANFIKNVVNKGKDPKKDDDKKDDEKDDKEDKDSKKDDKEDDKKKESVIDPKVDSFYADSVKVNESLVGNKEEILACGTLKEAQDLVLKLSNVVEKTDIEVKHENLNSKVKEGVKTASSITEKYRKDWVRI